MAARQGAYVGTFFTLPISGSNIAATAEAARDVVDMSDLPEEENSEALDIQVCARFSRGVRF